MSRRRLLRILGVRGVPAAHGGFETFAEQLSLYLIDRGWEVTVYCQEEGRGPVFADEWHGIRRVRIPVDATGPKATMIFDWKAICHAAAFPEELCLTLGYNTAVFCAWLRLRGVTNLINMDGIEWRRAKWGPVARAWFYANERAGCWLGNHLIADHPAIAVHLATRIRRQKISMIAYGAEPSANADALEVVRMALVPGRYLTVVARPEPENSLLEIVSGFSASRRGVTLAVLGSFDPRNRYHCQVKDAAGPEVRFLGAIYEKSVLRAIRVHCLAYVHGHQVGGTNPSLVEAMAAGNAVIAHDNRFNRWVAGEGARYFESASGFSDLLSALLPDTAQIDSMRHASLRRFQESFRLETILDSYERLLATHLPPEAS